MKNTEKTTTKETGWKRAPEAGRHYAPFSELTPFVCDVITPDNKLIACVYGENKEEAEVLAQYVSAAREMHLALRSIMRHTTYTHLSPVMVAVMKQARNAVDKAESINP